MVLKMKQHVFSALVLAAILFAAGACNKVQDESILQLKSISETSFTSEGGLGSAEIEANVPFAAESSAPEWLRVSTAKSSVLFNVFSYTGDSERTAVVTVRAEGVEAVSFTITQSAFHGIIVSETNLSFSDSEKQLQSLVKCTSDYEVTLPENPESIFSFTKSESGVTFAVSRAQSRKAFSGRACITPADGSIEPVYINLSLSKKSDWYYLLGTWKVTRNTDAGADKSDFVFASQTPLEAFDVSIQKGELASRPLSASFADGKVRIGIQGFNVDADANKYYSLHFNGPSKSNPTGWFIFSTPGSCAWAAEPVFDESSHTISLAFQKLTLDGNSVPTSFNIWWSPDRYFGFKEKIVSYEELVLTKEYTE